MDGIALRSRLLEIVAEVIEIGLDDLKGKEDVNLFEELGVDSLLALEIVATIEKEYDLRIEDEKIETLTTFNKVFDLVKRYIELKK